MDERGLRRVIRRPELEQVAAQIIASRRAKKTRGAYEADFRRWIAFCARYEVDPADPLLPHTTAFREELLKAYSNASVRRMLASLSLIYRGCAALGIARRNPFDSVILPRPKVSRCGTTPLVPDEHAVLMLALAATDSSVEGRRDHALLRLLYDTGMRRESAAALLREHIVAGPPPQLRLRQKGGGELLGSLPAPAYAALVAWLRVAPASRFAFPSGNTDVSLHPGAINRVVTAYAKMANVPHVHPHQFRAAYITAALDAGVPLREVQEAVGHADPRQTGAYDRHARGDTVADEVLAFRRRVR